MTTSTNMADMGKDGYFYLYSCMVCVFGITLTIDSVAGQCVFGSGCHFPCHCHNAAVCDPQTGDCGTAGCASGLPTGYSWGGPACQIGNVAYSKSASQTGTYQSYEAANAVDGFPNPDGDDGNAKCAHPDSMDDNVPVEWTVDLGRLHKIYNVSIYAPNDPSDCSRCPGLCYEVTGCKSCPAGKKRLPECNEDCRDGYFGENCTRTCGKCLNNTICNRETGQCPNGCTDWYGGLTCQVHVVDDSYDSEYWRVGTTTSDSIELTWEQQRSIGPDKAPYYLYEIQVRPPGEQWYTFLETPHTTNAQNRTTVVTGLKPNTQYDVRITICGKWKDRKTCNGAPYHITPNKTLCRAPSLPKITNVQTSRPASVGGAGRISVIYKLPSERGCSYIRSLWLQYKETSSTTWITRQIDQNTDSYSLDINPGTYDIQLVVSNNQNFNSTSQTTTVTVAAHNEASPASTTIPAASPAPPPVSIATPTPPTVPPHHTPAPDSASSTGSCRCVDQALVTDSCSSALPWGVAGVFVATSLVSVAINILQGIKLRRLSPATETHVTHHYENTDITKSHSLKLSSLNAHINTSHEQSTSGQLQIEPIEYEAVNRGISDDQVVETVNKSEYDVIPPDHRNEEITGSNGNYQTMHQENIQLEPDTYDTLSG